MTALEVDTDPAEVGFDAGRLARLDRRLARWVDDGQLPGFLVTVARHGKLVHVGRGGFRDMEAGLPVEDDTLPVPLQPPAKIRYDGFGLRVGVLGDDSGALHQVVG